MSAVQTDNVFAAYTSDVINAMAASKRFKEQAEGWYAAIVKDNIFTQSKTSGGNMFKTELTLLRDSNDITTAFRFSPTLYTAIADPARHDAKATSFLAGKLEQLVTALQVPGVIAAPRMVDGQLTYNGGTITKGEKEDADREASASVLVGAEALRQDPSMANNNVVFVKFGYQKDREGNLTLDAKGNKRGEIQEIRAELPRGKSLVDPSQAFV